MDFVDTLLIIGGITIAFFMVVIAVDLLTYWAMRKVEKEKKNK